MAEKCSQLVVAHLSDTHFGQYAGASARAQLVVEHLAAFDPPVDVVLVTGDVADHGAEAEYHEAARIFASWPRPILMCPGNHDVREPYARILRDRPGDHPINEAATVGGVRFIMLDSLVPAVSGQRIDHGYLEPATLEFLDAELARGPAVVCLHHPPVDLGLSLMDPIRLRNPADFEAVLLRHDTVLATLVGHAHTACATTFADRPLIVPGGVVSTVTLDAEHLPSITTDLDPTFAIHHFLDGGRVVTQWRTLPRPE